MPPSLSSFIFSINKQIVHSWMFTNSNHGNASGIESAVPFDNRKVQDNGSVVRNYVHIITMLVLLILDCLGGGICRGINVNRFVTLVHNLGKQIKQVVLKSVPLLLSIVHLSTRCKEEADGITDRNYFPQMINCSTRVCSMNRPRICRVCCSMNHVRNSGSLMR